VPRPIAPLLAALVMMLTLLLGAPGPCCAEAAAPGLPYVDVILIAEVYDAAGWVALHQEVLATPAGSTKDLHATLPARTGGGRAITIEQPKFTVAIVVSGGKSLARVTVTGKIAPALALVLVAPFEQAAMDIQSGGVTNELHLTYGLTNVAGRLLEVYFDRP
jgi:hypothetical protein